jgi:phosphatidylserine decarboxylase
LTRREIKPSDDTLSAGPKDVVGHRMSHRPYGLPVAKEGLPFIGISAAIMLVVFMITDIWWIDLFFILVTIFVIYFFRDPDRDVPNDPSAIVSPADGKVIKIRRVKDDRFLNTEVWKISIFMSVFNVHVNRVPATSKVLEVRYNPGKFLVASLDKASLLNEQNAVIAEGPTGQKYAFNQIAGLIARRIVCYAGVGMNFDRGERFGLIRFGSRVDVYLPLDCRMKVRYGQKVEAGASVLAYWPESVETDTGIETDAE